MSNPDRPRDPPIRAAAIVGSIDEAVYAASEAYRQTLDDAVTEDLAVAANQAAATDVRANDVEVRVDTLELSTAALTVQASATEARVDKLAAQAVALTQDLAVTADQQTALRADIAQRRALIDARFDLTDDQRTAWLADSAKRQAMMDARLENVARLAGAMGVIDDTPFVGTEIEPAEPPAPKPH